MALFAVVSLLYTTKQIKYPSFEQVLDVTEIIEVIDNPGVVLYEELTDHYFLLFKPVTYSLSLV